MERCPVKLLGLDTSTRSCSVAVSDGDTIVASMTVSMLDEGTLQRDKFEIARLLENRGTSISFQIDAERVGFQARCLRQDVPLLVELMAEQLREPRFDAEEFEKQKIQQKVLIEQDKNNTATQAQNVLTQILYPPKHPNYEPPFAKQLEDLNRLTLEDIRQFHRDHYGPRRMTLVAAGDVDIPSFEKAIERAFARWSQPKAHETVSKTVALQPDAVKRTLFLPDKVKVDVFFAHALPLTRLDPDYLPVFLANAILGGDFSARLTNTIRDEQGLTYSVHSEVHGVDRDIQGDWQINIILNNKLLGKGITATREQIEKWVREGIVAAELGDKQETLVGRFKVSLSTTSGLAHRILRFEELNLGAEYLDQYPRDIAAVTLEQTNQAIRRYFHPEQLHLVISGTVREQKSQTSSV
jgi:predicted Zn-dependent peptidase